MNTLIEILAGKIDEVEDKELVAKMGNQKFYRVIEMLFKGYDIDKARIKFEYQHE